MSDRKPIRRALVSVSDKTGLPELAAALHAAGVEIVSTGSTAARIAESGVPVTPVERVTGFPECLDGRVKTLHPGVHAGLLADVRRPEHAAQLDELAIAAFELLVVNLYPFAATVASGATADECVEQIDIGGPAMVRAAAKNHANVAVVVDPARYAWVAEHVAAGGFTLAERQGLAADAYRHTASYDIAVATWMADTLAPSESGIPSWLGSSWTLGAVLRYGENPHQRGALYLAADGATGAGGSGAADTTGAGTPVAGIASARQLHGKEMSFNNYVDADAALRAAYDHTLPCVAIVKHTNPCGIAVSTLPERGAGATRPDERPGGSPGGAGRAGEETAGGADGPGDGAEAAADPIADAHARAHACDPVSAFGGVIATNRPVTVAMAEQVAEIFTEVVVAPGYADGAVDVLARKKNVRLLVAQQPARGGIELRPVSGGVLLQDRDVIDAAGDDPAGWTLACGDPADEATLTDLAFAWRACRAVRSNAIVLAAGGATVGVGMGQVNRVDAARLAVARAGDRAAGSVGASDAFFPFPDGLQVLLDGGVRAVVQPGGSVRDAEVIEAAKAAGATLYLTGTRHFAH